MEIYQGVAITDGLNRKNHFMPLSAILKAYRDSWDRPIPMNLGHDRTKPIGYTKLTGVYMEPGKAYVTNEGAIMETSEEHEALRKMLETNDYRQFCEEHKDKIEVLVEKLGDMVSDSFRVAPVGQAVAIKDNGIVQRLFPEWTESFKDGLADINELESVYSTTADGEKGVLIPGVFLKDGYLLFAHQFFRRTLSILNSTNEEFFVSFEKLRDISNLEVKVALDMDMIGLPGTEHPEVEYQYIRGPHFDDNLESIPEGVTCHDNERYDNLFSNLVGTQFYWHKQDGTRTFECEELCDRENVSFDGGNTMLWGCRYVHSMLNPSTGLPTHLDGAIRIYDEEQFLERLDIKTDISKCGKNSKYIKLWRIDNEISVSLWKELISAFYRENPLIGEYFGGVDDKYEQIKKENDERDSLVVKPNDFEHIEFNAGDGCRAFLQYTDKFEIREGRDVAIYNRDFLLFEDGEKIKILDADTITLLKYLKRKGLVLRIPVTSLIAFNDMIYNFPTLCCVNESVADIVVESIKELCQVWMNKGDDRLISFGIMLNQQNEAGHLSFVGHINDFVQLLSNCKKLSKVSLDDWILDMYEKNNMFKQGNDYPNKFKLLHGDVLCFRRLIVRQDRIRRQWFEDGIMHAQFNLRKEEGDYLREHHIHAAPFYRIKRDRCCKCGEDYLQCSCVKFIDEDVADEVVEADLSGMTWTNRNAYFPNGQLEYI